MQKQQERLSKESLKKMMIQAIADATGLPNKHLTAVADKATKSEIVDKVKPQLVDVAAGDDDVDEFRSVAGDSLLERSRLETDKKDEVAQAVAESLSQRVAQTPIHHEAVGVQALFDLKDRGTEMTPYRVDPEKDEMQLKLQQTLVELEEAKTATQTIKLSELKKTERDAHRAHTSASS